MSLRKCPYCEHPNSADAKFCVACGAIMHLAPCPHCGAVNDISAKQCYRCHGELPGEKALDIAPASPAVEPVPVVVAAPAASPDVPSGRPSLLVVAVIALTFASAAYFAYRQRTAIAPPIAAPALPAAAKTEAAATGAITKAAPAPVSASTPTPVAATTAAEPAPVPATTVATEPAPARERGRRARREVIESPSQGGAAPTSARLPAPSPPAAIRGPCTEAVAALGLCKPEAK